MRHEDTNYSGSLRWRHDGANNELLLVSPFGQGIAEIVTSDSGARLTTSDGKVYSEANAETLTRQVLGYTLPFARLTDWVRAQVCRLLSPLGVLLDDEANRAHSETISAKSSRINVLVIPTNEELEMVRLFLRGSFVQ